MCGVAGYFGPREIEEARVQACLTLMRRRGPDNAAYRRWTTPAGNNVYLLNSRLSIIDLNPRSNQPFRVGAKWIAYNGELYNYVEIRRDLEQMGYVFTTRSDMEVLLAAIDRFGWQALDRCEGMWAFAVYDEADGSLTLCRDRFGEKPMYLYRDSTGLYFGSEVKFIMALLGRPLGVNMDQVCRYLVNGYKALYKDGHTFFQGLVELPQATVLRLDSAGREDQHKYWEPRYCPNEDMSYEDAIAGVQDRLLRAVEVRLRADVPLAFCMSGGIDSNSLISTAKRVFGYDVHGFTIFVPDERYDEHELVEYSGRELGIRHTFIPVDVKGFLPQLHTLVRYHDAPVYTINYFSQWQLMERVAEHGYRVSVSGTAGDELFSGYYDHHLFYLYEVREDPHLYATSLKAWEDKIKPLVQNPYLSDPQRFIRDPEFRDHIFLEATQFSQYLTNGWHEPFTEKHSTDSLLRNRMLNETFYETVPPVLHEDDLNAMYFSIENRSPFLDRALFEFCYQIPSRYLIRDGRAKAVLRDAMRGIVPDMILDSPRKVGFNAPIYAYLDVHDPEVRRYLLGSSPIFDHIRRDKIAELMGKPYLPNSESKFLFYFLTSKIFLEEFGA